MSVFLLLIITLQSVVIIEPKLKGDVGIYQTRSNTQCTAGIDVLCRKVDNLEKRQRRLKKQNEQLKSNDDQLQYDNENQSTDIQILIDRMDHLEERNVQLQAQNELLEELIRGLYGYVNSSNCLQIYNAGHTLSGIYQLYVINDVPKNMYVYCDHNSNDGGWTVIQRRFDGSVEFYRDWNQYKAGFGSLIGEFYLGNDNIYYLTKDKPHYIRFDLQDWEGNHAYAEYDNFQISSEADNYRVTFDRSSYTGTAGDSFRIHYNMQFSTHDRDTDQWSAIHCAEERHGAWWFNGCDHSHLNGEYFNSSQTPGDRGVIWNDWKGWNYSLKAVSMKIKPMT